MAILGGSRLQLREELDPLQVVHSLLPVARPVVGQRLGDTRDFLIKFSVVLDRFENIFHPFDFSVN